MSIPATSAPSKGVWRCSTQFLTAKCASLNEKVTSGYMFVKENLQNVGLHYDILTENMKDVLLLRYSGLPIIDGVVLPGIGVVEDLFSINQQI